MVNTQNTQRMTTFKTLVTLMLLFLAGVGSAWAAPSVWDGTTMTKPSGAGTEGSPYVITNAAEFAWFGNNMGSNTTYFRLDADIDLNNKEWKKGDNSSATFKGHFDGQGHTVSNVSITAVSGKNNGLFCNISGTDAKNRAEVKNLKIKDVTFSTTTGAAASTRIGAIAGYVKYAEITNVQVDGVSYTNNGDVSGAVYFAGAIGHTENAKTIIKGVTVENATLTANGNVVAGATLYLGGLIGYATSNNTAQPIDIKNCKVKNPVLTFKGNVENTTLIGGAIGMIAACTSVDGIYVEGGKIVGPSEKKTITNSKEFWVGGAVGKQHSSGTTKGQPNYIHNVAVSGMTIDLGKYEAGGVINNHKFGVGGVIGTVNYPNDDKNGRRGMPENLLFKGGKIYAPHAATSPTVANFNASLANYNNYTGENITSNIDCIEKSKAGTWLYSDYELGLSSELLNWEKLDSWNAAPAQNRWRKNFEDTKLAAVDASGVRYLSVSDETFKKQNRRLDNERPSKTVLWWTNQVNYATTGAAVQYFTENEQPIYPQNNFGTVGDAELVKFPYYMYFYQGVANAKYTSGTTADEIIKGIEANIAEAGKETPLTLTLRDNKIKYSDVLGSKDVRGFDAHTLTVTPSDNEAVDSYKWYVDGVEQDGATTNTFSLKPDWKTGKSIIVNAIKGSEVVASAGYALRVGVLKTKAGDAEEVGSDINSRGTKTNPYIIDSPEALRQWSMLSTMNTAQIWEGLVKPTATQNTGGVANQSQGHYNRAYYELGADIDLNKEPFIPISHVGAYNDGTDGTYANNWIFQGNFDGKGHKISNLNVTWSSGNINYNNYNQYWGLFGAIGHNVLTAKWGDGTTTSNTVVRNLVIDGATFTHDTNNKTFYYGNGSITTTNSNRAMIGVLAGIVNSNTTVENIEIRNSKITDEGSSDYDLAAQGLYVGGAIGSMQYAYNNGANNENLLPLNMTVRNIVADVNITLTHPKFHDASKPAEVGVFNVGGIIGRIIAYEQTTSIQTIMPSYTFFKGNVNAPKAWISPVIGAVRYKDQKDVTIANYTKQWEGNNGTAATQHSVTNAAYYKYYIGDTQITENNPDEECVLGSRTLDKHINGAYGDNPRELQGVNYNAKYISSEAAPFNVASGKILAIGMLNEGLAKQGVTAFTWEWNTTYDMPVMGSAATQDYAYLTRGTGTDLNAMRINTSYANATYKWYKYNNSDWEEIEGVKTYAYTATPDRAVNLFYKAEVYVDAVKKAETQTMMVKFVPMQSNFRINLAPATDNNVYSIVVTGDAVASGQTMTTQWYKADGTTLFTDGVDDEQNTLTLSDAVKAENKKIFCLVSVTDNTSGKTIFSQMVSYMNTGRVVYLMLNNNNTEVLASNGITYNATAAGSNSNGATYETATYGRTPDKPVNSWAGAYALLQDYTTAAITRTGYNSKQIKIDDSKNLVTVDDNVIVVMGLAKDGYFNKDNDKDGTIANKPATVTGKWDGVDYHGCIGQNSEHLSINADHKFEYIGFSKCGTGHFRLYAHRWNVHMGKGILMGYEAGLAAGKDDASNYTMDFADPSTGTPIGNKASDIAVMGGYLNDATSNNPEKNELVNHGRKEGQIIKIESGQWGPVCPGNRQTDKCISYFMMGGPENPAKTTFIIDIDREWNDAHRQYKKGEYATVDVGCLLTGNHEGSMYADVVLDIRSGKMGRVVNGIKGSQRVYGPNDGFMTGGNYRHIVRNINSDGIPVDGSGVGSTAGSGTKWLYTSAPAPDSYIGRGVINISPAKAENYTGAGSMNDRVSVIELYCGSLGRCHNVGYFHPEVATSFFGQSIVNIEGGTFYNTIYGAGAGGVNGIGTDENHTDDNAIPFYKDGNTDYVWYAPYEYLKETNNLGNIVSVSYHNNETLTGRDGVMSVDGTIDLRDTYSFINITGGVFGSETSPVSIYAGGSGETDDALINMADKVDNNKYIRNFVQTPSHQAGCFFGSGNGVASEIRIKNATVYGNIYGGGKGTAKYYRWISLTPATTPENIASKSNTPSTAFENYATAEKPANYASYLVKYTKNLRANADNYLKLGQVYGNTKITIGENTVIRGNVFGGGEGVADMTQEDFIAGTGMTLTLDNADLNISNMTDARTAKQWVNNTIADKDYISFPDMGKVFGKAQINIEDGAIIHGNVYGGGDAGSIEGIAVDGSGNPIVAKSSEVNISGGEIYGSVFGAGKGLTIDKAANYEEVATITGDATVNLTGGTIWQNMYGGGQNAVVTGDTHFNMSGGNIAANVYGGGMGNVNDNDNDNDDDNDNIITRANIYGNTNVNITGGQIVWDRSSLSGEQEVDVTIYNYTRNIAAVTVTNEEYESSTDNTADKVQATYTAQNYTGVTATSNGSETRDEVTYFKWKVTYTIPAHTETVSFDYEANPEGYTAAGTTTEKRKLTSGQVIEWNINDPSSAYYTNFYDEINGKFNIEHNIFGGGYLACNVGKYYKEGDEIPGGKAVGDLVDKTGKATVNVTKGLFGMDLLRTRQWQTAYNDNENPHFYVFGGGYGIHTKVETTYVDVNITAGGGSVDTDEQLSKPLAGPSLTSLSNPTDEEQMEIISNAYGQSEATVLGVLGGGYNGWVGATDVLIDGNTYCHRAYGGGLGSYQGWVDAGKPATIGAMTDASGYVGITGETRIEIAGGNIYGDVFGGGAGVAPNKKEGTLTDYTEIARTMGDTHVIISDNANIFGRVYGGGDVANVGKAGVAAHDDVPEIPATKSKVTVVGGNIYGDLFGGGSGRKASEANVYSSIGNVAGNTVVTINKTAGSPDIIPNLFGDIYGGCAFGTVNGNTEITVNAGNIGNNIFGGGFGSVDSLFNNKVFQSVSITSANVNGNTNVNIYGGSYMWKTISDVAGNTRTFVENNGTAVPFTDILAARTNPLKLVPHLQKASDIFNMKEKLFMNINGQYYDHNIYGGGNIACAVTGNANVTMYHGMLDDELGNADDATWKLGALLRYLILDNKLHPQFAVFGGGYGVNTNVGATNVNIEIGKQEALGTDKNYTDFAKDTKTWSDFYDNPEVPNSLINKFAALTKEEKESRYGGATGANAFARYLSSRMCWTFGVPNHTVLAVAGGGLAGSVTGNTSVNIDKHSGALAVYGGGIGAVPTIIPADQAGADAINYAQVGGNTSITIGGGVISRNVYGGGGGIESIRKGETLLDFPNMALVRGTTSVNIDGESTNTLIYGKVYGGGDVANVGTTAVEEPNTPNYHQDPKQETFAAQATINIAGGCIFQPVYGGGSGRKANVCGVYQNLGAVKGNTRVIVNESSANRTWLWANLYGGGENGVVYGNTDLRIAGGSIGYDVFGGGYGAVDNIIVAGEERNDTTSADVKQNTNVMVTGGQWCLSQKWDVETRSWLPTVKDDEGTYSSQYDPVKKKFNINHNIYGGGNVASVVGKDSHVTMTKGMLTAETTLGHDYSGSFFAQKEWQNIYNKHASAHMSVFGGGYGNATTITRKAYTNVNMSGEILPASDHSLTKNSSSFIDSQSLMDIIGGGYEGKVSATDVTVQGNGFMRNIFGGGYYAEVDNATTTFLSGNADDIYGGGMMGDVHQKATVTIGSGSAENANKQIMILGSVYGANDVSGIVGAEDNDGVLTTQEDYGASINLYGGHIRGNVYGGGNGNYLYMVDKSLDQIDGKIKAYEDYEINEGKKLVYGVPLREDFGSFVASNEVQRIINIATWRPVTIKTAITMKGNEHPVAADADLSSKDFLLVDGGVFGGGNSATVSDFTNNSAAAVTLNIGSNIKLNSLYLGSDGAEMFKDEESNTFIKDFPALNNITMSNPINWNDVENASGVPDKYMTLSKAERSNVYKNMLDLYFLPVEMSFVPTVTWANDIDNTFIGTFCCGGNRGNMTTTDKVNITFPEGLTIMDKIVGGCNDANYTLNKKTANPTFHEGGYLYGTHELGYQGDGHTSTNPQIKLVIKNKFLLSKTGGKYNEAGNVYGGCYQSGTVRGDVEIDMRSDMLKGLNDNEIEAIRIAFEDDKKSVASVYGGGFGSDTYVYGDTRVTLGNGVRHTNENQASIYNMFGGGQQGNVIGSSNVQIINGHAAGNVVGGSYAGYLYGSTNVQVGFPRHYVCQESGEYTLLRKDNDATHKTFKDAEGNDYIKQSIKLLKGACVSKAIIDEITHKNGVELSQSQKDALFVQITDKYKPQDFNLAWKDINIKVDRAIYGGGYSLAEGSTVGAGAKTVRKFGSDAKYNLNDAKNLALYGLTSTEGYGGHTNVMLCDLSASNQNTDDSKYSSDHKEATSTTDHITLSTGIANKVTAKDGDPLFGLYYMKDQTMIYVSDREATFPCIAHTGMESGTEEEKIAAAREIKYYRYTGEGGLFGDGHLSFSEGFRFGEITRYGYAGTTPAAAKLMNCIHRFDLVRVKDCCMSLMGDRDYVATATGDKDTEPYAIARVGELQMTSSYGASDNLPSTKDASQRYTERKSRNYIGLSSNVRNLGALYSDVDIASDYHDYNGQRVSDKTYYTFKKGMIEDDDKGDYNYSTYKSEEAEFAMRNDGTSHNLIGIASGLSLRVQDAAVKPAASAKGLGAATLTSGPAGTEEDFYGPIKGVIEVCLINVIPGEAGGYVYAQNNHLSGNSFIEEAGNIVYPVERKGDPLSTTDSKKVVDDCFPAAYNASYSNVEGHYWFVTGYKYVFDRTISGYTSDVPYNQFNLNNKTGYIRLTGAAKNKDIYLESVKFLPHSGTNDVEDKFKGKTANSALEHAYQLNLMFTQDNIKYKDLASMTEGEKAVSLHRENVPDAVTPVDGKGLSLGTLKSDEPYLAICLLDNVENNGTDENGTGKSYYENHLSEPLTMELKFKIYDEEFGHGHDVDQSYEYTVNLTINYIQGPNYTGYVMADCALPGEVVRLSKEHLTLIHDKISMPKIGEKWEFGKIVDGNITPNEAMTFTVDDGTAKAGAEVRGAYVDEDDTKPYVYIPAYYFMNGYGIRYSFKVQGIDDWIPVTINPEHRLEIHNYHRMKSGIPTGMNQVVNHKLYKAAKRAKAEATAYAALTDVEKATAEKPLPMPRAYIEDAEDLAAFRTYIGSEKDIDGNDIPAEEQNGSGVDFHLMANLSVPAGTAHDFKGNFHGNGHVLSGNGLFAANSGNIYNLGMNGASIAATNTGKIENCYAYGANLLGTKGGTINNCYTNVKADGDAQQGTYASTEDFRYGKVAYNLNRYYLEARYRVLSSLDPTAADCDATAYVRDLYGNGDYQYALYNNSGTRNGDEYLRTNPNVHYGSHETYHNTSHAVDKSRAFYDGESNFVEYRPLFDAVKQNASDALTTKKNDFLFFGQSLATADNLPTTISNSNTHELANRTNRVYRAYGYYGNNTNQNYYYNAEARVHANGITAIDFKGYGDTGVPASNTGDFAPVIDNGDVDVENKVDGINHFTVSSGVTRNLLTYIADESQRTTVFSNLNYTASTLERYINGHLITPIAEPEGDVKAKTQWLHLVERTAADTDAEGYACLNNDFNAPIAFNVTDKAWYVRKPASYAESSNSAWEGIALPFTATKVEASLNGEITHFYGTPTSEQLAAPETNDKTLHHEYWLRGLTGVADSKATFQRPGEGLFAQGSETISSYVFTNNWFVTTYGDKNYNYADPSNQNNWYDIGVGKTYEAGHTYADYKPLTADIPYIVSFPGKRYYEFDLSSQFYNEKMDANEPEQTITFSHNVAEGELLAIGVTDDATRTTAVVGYNHTATYSAITDAEYGMNAAGNAYDAASKTVMPFRTYMQTAPAAAKELAVQDIIYIAEMTAAPEKMEPIMELENPEDGITVEGMRIYPRGNRVIVESTYPTTLKMFTAGGHLMRVLDVRQGINTYSGFAPGVYVVDKKKLQVK